MFLTLISVTSEEFRSFFDQFGKVVDSVVMFDRITSRSRGFGFVTFEDPAVCSSLLGHGNIGRIVMCGKVVEIKPAEPKVPDETRDSGNAMKAPYTKTTYENVPHAVYDFTMMEQPDSPNTAAVYGFVPSPFYPNTFDDSGAVAPVPLGMYYPMVAPVMPHEQNGAFYGPIPYQYNYADYMPNGTYGYLPTAYPEGLDNYYPGDPESVMQKVAPGIPVKPDDGSEGY